MTPVLNYGEVVTDDHCLIYGAVLQGLGEEEFYRKICQLAELVEAESLLTGENEKHMAASGGCGSDWGCH